MRIYLVGYSYGGKTTIGRQLAALMGMDFVDTDSAIEEKYHTTVPIFFDHYGEQAFRVVERGILHSVACKDNAVIATGGGLPCSGDNMDFIVQSGIAVYFRMTVDEILHRAVKGRKRRPLLYGLDDGQRRETVQKMLDEREPYYMRAQLTVDAEGLTAETLAAQLKSYMSNQ